MDIDYLYTPGIDSGSRIFLYEYQNVPESAGGTFARWQEVSCLNHPVGQKDLHTHRSEGVKNGKSQSN